MTIFITEALRVDSTGAISVVSVTIDDPADAAFTSAEIGVRYVVQGVAQGPDAPVLESVQLTVTWTDGTVHPFPVVSEHFVARDGSDIYLPSTAFDVNRIGAVVPWAPGGAPGGIPYAAYGTFDAEAVARTASALVITNGVLADPVVSDLTVWDDDATLELDGAGSGAASETGAAPAALSGVVPFFASVLVDADTDSVTNGIESLREVSVEYDSTGDGVTDGFFNGLIVTEMFGINTYSFLIPAAFETVDLATIVEVIGWTDLGAADGTAWADWGLAEIAATIEGGSGADQLLGTFRGEDLNGKDGRDTLYAAGGDDVLSGGKNDDTVYGGAGRDMIEGKEGADSLIGGAGADTLEGGDGKDWITGGQDADTLTGGKGGDTLSGGRGRDGLEGSGGGDVLFGGDGEDTLAGGAGGDSLYGGAASDLLDDGGGADLLLGDAGADIFVVLADGETDEILDFEDGLDLLDIGGAAFTVADVAAGTVEVTYLGEVLVVSDGGLGLLTAADITAADVI